MVGELSKKTSEMSGLPPRSLVPLVWVILKHSQVADLLETPWLGLIPIYQMQRLRARQAGNYSHKEAQ